MSANGEPSVPAVIRTAGPLPPPTFWDLCHWITVRDSALKGTVEGWLAAKEMVKLWGPQRPGMAAHPALPALCVLVRDRWGPRPAAPQRWEAKVGEAWVALDTQACLDLRLLLCQHLGIRPAEADRLILSDVADHLCYPSVPPVPSAAGAESAGDAVGGTAKTVRESSSASTKRGKGKMIDECMVAELRDNPISVEWSAKEWADRFKCSKSTIAGTKTWRESIRFLRNQERYERRGDRSDDS